MLVSSDAGTHRIRQRLTNRDTSHRDVQQLPEHGEIDWFRHVVMETGTERLFAIFIAAPTGQGDEGDVAPTVLLSNQGGGLITIEFRQ